MSQIIYSSERIKNPNGRKVKNPNYFVKPVEGVTKVFLNGDFPNIRRAYEEANVVVERYEPPKRAATKTSSETTATAAKGSS